MDWKILALTALSIWWGGLLLFMGMLAPAAFRTFKKQEAGRFLSPLFHAVDRWGLFWGGWTVLFTWLLFQGSHASLRALIQELPVLGMFVLTAHSAIILHPQIQFLKEKIARSEYDGTAHQKMMTFSFKRLHKTSVMLHGVMLMLGALGLLGLIWGG